MEPLQGCQISKITITIDSVFLHAQKTNFLATKTIFVCRCKIVCYCQSKYYTIRVHILVGRAFVPNPDNLKELNHEDGDKTNNNDWNLKWSTRKYNIQHSFSTGLNIPKKGSNHHQFNRGKKVIYQGIIYDSIAGLAREIDVPRTSICSELDGRMKTKIGVEYVD